VNHLLGDDQPGRRGDSRASATVAITARPRPNPTRCNRATTGLSTNVMKIASAIGMNTDRAQNRARTTVVMTTVADRAIRARCQSGMYPPRAIEIPCRRSVVSARGLLEQVRCRARCGQQGWEQG
jgi:hypothetical protein